MPLTNVFEAPVASRYPVFVFFLVSYRRTAPSIPSYGLQLNLLLSFKIRITGFGRKF